MFFEQREGARTGVSEDKQLSKQALCTDEQAPAHCLTLSQVIDAFGPGAHALLLGWGREAM
jgi:hypothetical protein